MKPNKTCRHCGGTCPYQEVAYVRGRKTKHKYRFTHYWKCVNQECKAYYFDSSTHILNELYKDKSTL